MVLVVEDQPPIANYYKMVLNMAGMDAQATTRATRVIQQMIEYHPDLILLDLYMPDVNGAELVKVIRQMEEFVSIPIVFLSSEDDFAKQMEAMSLGYIRRRSTMRISAFSSSRRRRAAHDAPPATPPTMMTFMITFHTGRAPP